MQDLVLQSTWQSRDTMLHCWMGLKILGASLRGGVPHKEEQSKLALKASGIRFVFLEVQAVTKHFKPKGFKHSMPRIESELQKEKELRS